MLQEDLPTEAELTDNDILAQVVPYEIKDHVEGMEDDGDSEPPKPISLKEATIAIETLQQFFEDNHFSIEHVHFLHDRLNDIDDLKNSKLKQTCITDYFSK